MLPSPPLRSLLPPGPLPSRLIGLIGLLEQKVQQEEEEEQEEKKQEQEEQESCCIGLSFVRALKLISEKLARFAFGVDTAG